MLCVSLDDGITNQRPSTSSVSTTRRSHSPTPSPTHRVSVSHSRLQGVVQQIAAGRRRQGIWKRVYHSTATKREQENILVSHLKITDTFVSPQGPEIRRARGAVEVGGLNRPIPPIPYSHYLHTLSATSHHDHCHNATT